MPRGSPFITGPRGFAPRLGATTIFTIVGQLLSASGSPIVGATVDLFATATNVWIAQTTSDSTGAYSFNPPTNGAYWSTFFLAGSPNQFGRTDHLVPS